MFRTKEPWCIGAKRNLLFLSLDTGKAGKVIGKMEGTDGDLFIKKNTSLGDAVIGWGTPFSILVFFLNSRRALKPYCFGNLVIRRVWAEEKIPRPICFSDLDVSCENLSSFSHKGYDKIALIFIAPEIEPEDFGLLFGIQPPWATPQELHYL